MSIALITVGVFGCAVTVAMIILNLKKGKMGAAALMAGSFVLYAFAFSVGYRFL